MNFTEFLRQKFAPTTGYVLSLQQLAKLPVKERHQHLQSAISATAIDFCTDPELTEFAVLDNDYELNS